MRARGMNGGFTRQEVASRKEPLHRFHKWTSTFVQICRYCMVGGVNTGIDLLALNGLLWRFPTHNALVLMLYNSIAYSCGAVSSFCLNKYWTFRRTQKPTGTELRRFLISILLELVSSNILVLLVGKVLQPFIPNPTLWGNATKLVAIVSGVIISYSLMRFWTFASSSQEHHKKETKSRPLVYTRQPSST
jgi:putative flippase GtrA